MKQLSPKPSASTAILQDLRWQQLQAGTAEPHFIYGVITTGIYCRSGCPSPCPKPENLRFFSDSKAAETAGFRACKRCKPAIGSADAIKKRIENICRFIDSAEQEPSLAQLAAHSGISPHHLQRQFKTITGLTPKAYAKGQRLLRLQAELNTQQSITQAGLAAGYSASNQLYRASQTALGMTPSNYKKGGNMQTIHFALGKSALGALLVAQSARGVCAILLGDDPQLLLDDLQQRFPRAELIGDNEQFQQLLAQVAGFIERPLRDLQLPLDIRGTLFQQKVWQALQQIPLGETRSYTDIAAQIGAPKAVRAVASACAANALALAIPCHRVVRQDGSLSGYRWGLERKAELIAREHQAAAQDD